MKKLAHKYLVYIIYFLGVGMTSSGIVLMPFNPVRYSIILGTGLCLFIASSMFNEVVIDKRNLSAIESLKLVILSLTLAIGIGMISGGIAHFKESPIYVSYLIPIGIVTSFISYTLKNNFKLTKKEKLIIFPAVIIVAIIIFAGLSAVASGGMINTAPGGDIFINDHQ